MRSIKNKKSKMFLAVIAMCLFLSQSFALLAKELVVPPINVAGAPEASVIQTIENQTRDNGTAVGDLLKITATLTNNGENSTWFDVSVLNTFENELDFASDYPITVNGENTTVYQYNESSRELVIYDLGDIEGPNSDDVLPPDVIVVSYFARVNASGLDTTFENIVSAEGLNAAFDVVLDYDIVEITVGFDDVLEDVDIDVSKTVEDATREDGNTAVGNTLTYTITATNNKEHSIWNNVRIIDILPVGVTFNENSIVTINGVETTEYVYDNGTLTIPVGNVEGNQSVVVTFSVTVNESSYQEVIANEATLTGDNYTTSVQDDGIRVITNNVFEDTDIDASKEVADLTREDGNTIVGNTLTYTVTITNNKEFSIWNNVHVIDTLPVGVTFDENSTVTVNGVEADYLMGDGTLSILVGNLEANQTAVVTFTVTVNGNSYQELITNDATITGEGYETTVSDQGIRVIPINEFEESDIDVSKEVADLARDDGNTIVGNTLTYTITLTNNKAYSLWNNVQIIDTLPAGVTFDENSIVTIGSVETTNYNYINGVLFVPAGNVEGNQTVVITFSVTVNQTSYQQVINNVAIISSNSYTTAVSDQGIRVITNDQIDESDIDVSKEVTDNAREDENTVVNNTLTYTITATNNNEQSVWNNVRIIDTLPVGVTFDENSIVTINGIETMGYTYENGVLTIPVGNIQPNQTVIVTFSVTVNENSYLDAIHNEADIIGDNYATIVGDDGINVVPDTPNADDIYDLVEVRNLDRLSSLARVGDTLRYTITLQNTKLYSIWTNVYLTVVLPEQLELPEDTVVYIDEVAVPYEYNEETRVLTIALGDLEGGNPEIKIVFDLLVISGFDSSLSPLMQLFSADERNSSRSVTNYIYE